MILKFETTLKLWTNLGDADFCNHIEDVSLYPQKMGRDAELYIHIKDVGKIRRQNSRTPGLSNLDDFCANIIINLQKVHSDR